jgi:ATP-dependent Clp protease protease subunit
MNALAPVQVRDAKPARQQPLRSVWVSFLGANVNARTSQALLGTVAHQLAQGFNDLHLMVSTPGGGVAEGLTIYNVLRALPMKVTTYNVGNVNSIGNMIFLAGSKRFAAPSCSFMFHGVGFDITNARIEEKEIEAKLDALKNDQQLIADVIVRHTAMSVEVVRNLFATTAFMPANVAKAEGIVDDVIDIQVPPGVPFHQLAFQ